MEIVFWGVRGSYPAPGADTVEYGGNTPCLQVQAGDSMLIVDAGTGIYALGRQSEDGPAHYHLLFSHVHWDHIQGLPFFAPLYDPAVRLTVHATPRFLPTLRNLLEGQSRELYLPVPRHRLQAQIVYRPFQLDETFDVGAISTSAVKLNHPYVCAGFRFDAHGRSVVVYSDTAPFTDIFFGYGYRPHPPRADEPLDEYEKERLSQMHDHAVALAAGADLLIHDAHFTVREYPRYAHFGHSTPAHALQMARETRINRLLLFHHAPSRTDGELAELEARYRTLGAAEKIELSAAREGHRVIV